MRFLLSLTIAFVVFLLDQVSKIFVIKKLSLYESINIIYGFDLTLTYNQGIAFSMMNDGFWWQKYFLTSFSAVVSIAIAIWLYVEKKNNNFERTALALILGGALGNLYDRITYGYVIDFIHWYVGSYHWPIFNLADSAITLGAAILVIDMVFLKNKG